MLSALPITTALSPIHSFERTYVKPSQPFFLLRKQCPITGRRTIESVSSANPNQTKDLNPASPVEYLPPSSEQLRSFIQRELVLLYDDARLEQSERVMQYLARAESRELDPWAQDDIRIAWQAVLYAARGYEKPWEYAFWFRYGKTYQKLVPIWVEERSKRDAMLGPGLSEGEAVYPAKKKPQSVREVSDRKAGEL